MTELNEEETKLISEVLNHRDPQLAADLVGKQLDEVMGKLLGWAKPRPTTQVTQSATLPNMTGHAYWTPDASPPEALAAQLETLVTQQRIHPPELATMGANALWDGSVSGHPQLVALGSQVLARVSKPDMHRRNQMAYLEAAIAEPFTPIHAAWAEGRPHTAGDMQKVYAGLGEILRVTLSGPEDNPVDNRYMMRAMFAGLVARAGSTETFILPSPPIAQLNRAPNSYIVTGSTLTAAHLRMRNNRDRHPLSHVALVASRFADHVILEGARDAYPQITGHLPAARRPAGAVRYISGLIVADQNGGSRNPQLLDYATQESLVSIQHALQAKSSYVKEEPLPLG